MIFWVQRCFGGKSADRKKYSRSIEEIVSAHFSQIFDWAGEILKLLQTDIDQYSKLQSPKL